MKEGFKGWGYYLKNRGEQRQGSRKKGMETEVLVLQK